MASAQNSVQDPQTKVVQHNHIIIKYQQPLDPAIVNHVLGTISENYEKLFLKRIQHKCPIPKTIYIK